MSDKEPSITSTPTAMFDIERYQAHQKHGDGSMEGLDWRDRKFLPVLLEEVGEVAHAICENHLGNIDEEELREELILELTQVGAMAAAWLEALIDGR